MGIKKKERLVVVGNGMAGSACVEEIIKADPERYEITVFGAERHMNYNRVLLGQVLTGEKTLEEIALNGSDWYTEHGIRLLTGKKVIGIKRRSRTVETEDGTEEGYDRLILATGSLPAMPPVDGIEKDGVVTFRNIEDCERIRALVGEGGGAVVIGGGLLGLEAAWGLKSLGVDVTLVHLMDRLMERQLDSVSAGLLKDDLERLGIRVLLGKKTVAITGGEKVEGVAFSDGSSLPARLVVMSVGIRPNAGLAAASGIYTDRGIVVSDTMQTYDPAVWAVGECVEHTGATFGLVGPVFEQARVLANHLAGDGRMVFEQKPASTRLKIPSIDLYSAGAVYEAGEAGEAGGMESVEYLDRGAGLYKRLMIRDGRLTGIIMYGETDDGPALFTALLEGEDITHRRRGLLLGGGAEGVSSVEQMPDNAIVCGCKGVTKGEIVEAIETKGLFTREDVKRETGASGSCGGCASMVDRILEFTLGSSFEAGSKPSNICECTTYSRDDVIKNIREKSLRSVAEVMDTLGWEKVGCEVCRPALNYYVSMVWPGSAEDDPSSRLVNERNHANIQNDGTFSVVPRISGGAVTPAELKRIADAAVKWDLPLVKITGGQRIALVGVGKDDLPAVWKDLAMPSGYAYGKALRTVKTCMGLPYCRYGTQDSLSLGVALENAFTGLWMPAKVKMSVSGCPRNCSESAIKDIGIVGVTGGWEIYAGGCGGVELKGAEKLATVATAEEVFEVAGAFLQLYREEAHYGERTFKWVVRAGLGEIMKKVVEDAGGRAELYSRLMEAAKSAQDPWQDKASALAGEPGAA
ncbi:MAG: nitrite reductase large subunit NirB [Thermodesulfobacteriota bacterium]|nr:MAG: nitrite reductase large subunit NirB [Thermodesulfobacteriota bacterium]